MAVIGEIAVNVVANTAGLEKGLDRSRQKVKSFEASLGGLRSAMLGAAGVVGGLAFAFYRQVQAIDELNDRAKQLNASFGGLASLQYTATMTGDKFEDLTTAIGIMQVRLGEVAETGKGPAAEALQKLGLSAKMLVGMKADDAFQQIAGGLAAIDNSAVRASTAVDIFGKGGKNILNTLNEGADGLARFRREAEQMGLVLRQDTVDAVAKLDDEVQKLKNRFMNGPVRAGAGFAADALAGRELVDKGVGTVSPGRGAHNPYFMFPFLGSMVQQYNDSAMYAPPISAKDRAGLAKENYVPTADPAMAQPSAFSNFLNEAAKKAIQGLRSADKMLGSRESGKWIDAQIGRLWQMNRNMELRQVDFEQRQGVKGGPLQVGINRAIDYNSNEGAAAKAAARSNDLAQKLLDENKKQTQILQAQGKVVLAQWDIN